MNKLEITKTVTTFIVGAGTTKIASGIIKNNTNPKNVYDIVTITSGAVVIGMMAADRTKEYTGAKIDGMAAAWNKAKSKNTTEEKK